MNTQKIHIFRTGTHTAMGGQSLHFSEMDLQRTAMAYKPSLHVAPLVLGHPDIDSPAYGDVSSVQAQGGNLYAMAQVSDTLKELVRARSYLRVSAAFYDKTDPRNPVPGTYYLRHVGFLGATPPAVKGLVPPAFASVDGGCLVFADGVPLGSLQHPQALPMGATGFEGYSVDPERMALHQDAMSITATCPSLSFADAITYLEQQREEKTRYQGYSMAPEAVAMHQQVLGIQSANPGMGYETALNTFLGR
jgi:hypothetical protein